ncbi:flagellar basal body protein [Candidatus Cyrtobacter comes]|nr:flagellar basal body protein [Candidatus Cyrtobacter comes]
MFVNIPSAAQDFSLQEAAIAALSGMDAQSQRLKVIAQNIANADNVARTPDADPYRRKVIFFKKSNAFEVAVYDIKDDLLTPFNFKFDPNHIAANKYGEVTISNVNIVLENIDMAEAKRIFQANATSYGVTKQLKEKLLESMK